MDIVLVRHGKAAKLSYESDDSKRKLTKTGKVEIKKTVPLMKIYLNQIHQIFIWSSPSLRASQTARIIADELKIEDISIFDFIRDGDLLKFTEELKNIENNSTIIIVGHEPFISEWSFMLYGLKLPFKKGTMAGFEVKGISPLKGDLKWIFHAKLCPKYNSQGQQYKSLTKKDFKYLMNSKINEIIKMQDLFLKTPDDPESVHQIRVKIRQLRSLLSFIKNLLNEQGYIENQDKLRQLSKKFSYIREIDVITEEWNDFINKNPDILSENKALSSVLSEERSKQTALLVEYTSQGHMNNDLDDVAEWIDTWNEESDDDCQFSEYIRKKYKKWVKKIDNDTKNVDCDNFNEIHNIRIQFKKLRCIQSSIGAFIDNEKYDLEQLKEIQDEFGKLCDVYRNISDLQLFNSDYEIPNLEHETGIFIGHQTHKKEKLAKNIKKILNI